MQQPQQGQGPTAGPYSTPSSGNRFAQQPYVQQSPTSAQSHGRSSSGADAQILYNFQQGVQYGAGPSSQTSQMQYEQQYQPQEAQRPPSQPYQQYAPSAMYSMQPPQAQGQATPQQDQQTQYEQIPQYRQQRPQATPEALAPTYGQPQSATQYYLAAQNLPTSTPSQMPGSNITAQYQQQPAYGQPGPSTSQLYPGAMLDPVQTAGYPGYGQSQQQQQYTAQQQQQQAQAQAEAQQQQAESIDQGFSRYQTQVRTLFTGVRDGELSAAPESLVDISRYLLGSAEALGLTRDDEAMHDDRIRLWDEFNRAWLTVMQRQYDLSRDRLRSGQTLQEAPSLINRHSLEQLAKELARLCDDVEKFGLVDYQMGVAEESIMDLILRCLTLFDGPTSSRDRASASQAAAGAALPSGIQQR
ncbi:hypothetical protein B0A48_05153 [Cryoendolithus antarcticus]|uniref:Uncharacterized protein n=1 Tax=Cryoendolithus antarcticus TaxID=1507870 RepID=A0A1V8TEE4_9PEZI|nr:hypothetical protein B0A48_05153 [Cryoendolithus antarcticus]